MVRIRSAPKVLRKLRKKLRQIEQLKQKRLAQELTSEQIVKIGTEAQILQAIQFIREGAATPQDAHSLYKLFLEP